MDVILLYRRPLMQGEICPKPSQMAARKRTRDFLETTQPEISSAADEVRVARLTPGEVFKDCERLGG